MIYIKNLTSSKEDLEEKQHRILARELATEGIVLLKNDGVLPLKIKNIALFGNGARKTIKGGLGSGEVNERYSVSIYDGLINNGFRITTTKYLDEYDIEYNNEFEKFKKEFRKKLNIKNIITGKMAEYFNDYFDLPVGRLICNNDLSLDRELAIYVISRQSSEGADRNIDKGENDFQENEINNLRFLKKKFKKVILIINSGCFLNIHCINELELNGIIFFGLQGEEGGNALADILKGKVSPSAKLASTWPKDYNDIPFAEEYSYLGKNLNDAYYKEGIYVGYRYFDSFFKDVLFPFGFGLSYSSFEINCEKISLNKTIMNMEISVKNTGEYSAKEVVQCYLSSPNGNVDKEYQSLVSFKKTALIKPQEETKIFLSFDFKNCAYFNENKSSYSLDRGAYFIRLGNSSRNSKVIAKVILDEDVDILNVEHICKPLKEITHLDSKNFNFYDVLSEDKVFNLLSKDFSTKTVDYSFKKDCSSNDVKKIINTLSIKEMISLIVGVGMFKNTAFSVPGAVGSTTSSLITKGVPNVLLSDGPAGLRLQRRSAITKNNKIKMVDSIINVLDFLPNFLKKFIFGNPKNNELIYQYCTAFPSGMSIAQTWNLEIVQKFGEAISEEMTKFGVTYWLAPGINIHRNPLCGRNFEYYSEDPYLSGIIASYVSKGVQKIPGHYVTIKHFSCNNQEENRSKVSSNLDERVLREIYLKAFKIAIEEGGAKSIMTSYNKVNGIYSANSYDLCTKFARNECGFNGVIMTDWTSTAKGCASNIECLKAGNDLIMPGNKKINKELFKAFKNNKLSKEDIVEATTNILSSIINSYDYNFIIKKLQDGLKK